jgi:hypothetical protein
MNSTESIGLSNASPWERITTILPCSRSRNSATECSVGSPTLARKAELPFPFLGVALSKLVKVFLYLASELTHQPDGASVSTLHRSC